VTPPSRCDDARAIARDALCEGYLLDPYAAGPISGRGRWSFGVLHARDGADAARGERWSARVQCLARAPGTALVAVRARFLQLAKRGADGAAARDRQVDSEPASLWALSERTAIRGIVFPGVGGELSVGVDAAPGGFFRVTAELRNFSAPAPEPLASAFLSPHLLLGLGSGTFVSLENPASAVRSAASSCSSDGLRAALVGDERESPLVLASPVIVFDGPSLAPETTG
jgi:hypothetical protein